MLVRVGSVPPVTDADVGEGAVLYQRLSSDRQRTLYMVLAAAAAATAGVGWLFWWLVVGMLADDRARGG